MKIVKMRANHLEQPLGYALDGLSLSWQVEEAQGSRTASAHLRIALDEAMTQVVYDSGEGALDSLGVCPGIALEPRTRYYWEVAVRSNAGEKATGTSWFETGKLGEAWAAKWITAPKDGNGQPLLRNDFTLDVPVKSARAYVCGLGVYELYINGEKIGDEYLTPGCNNYNFWKQYQTYDLTASLKEGKNTLGAMMGNGWYKGRFGFERAPRTGIFGDTCALICEVHVEFADGRELVISTDQNWKWYASPVVESSIYDGECWDARMLHENWCLPEGGAEFRPVLLLEDVGYQQLTERLSPPIVITQRLPVTEVLHTAKGETVLDFGQEVTGWVEFTCRLPKGAKVFLQYSEIMQDGCFYNDNLRSAKAEYTYISDGEERLVRPHFTFYGFRYLHVVQEGAVNPADFTACVLHSELEFTGTVDTSDPRVNRLFLNALWGQRGNFLDVPTDCPQRDERMGWTGDAQVFAATASFNMYTPAFYTKYMYDMLMEQKYTYHGSVPHVVPMVIGDGDKTSHGSCAWADAAAVIPWTIYQFYGDKALLEREYPNMKLWADYLKLEDEQTGGKRLRQTGFHFADWLALDNPDKESCLGGTDCYYIASAYYYYSVLLTAKAAKALGHNSDAASYGKLAEQILVAFQAEYLLPGGKTKPDTQTSYAVALMFDLVPEKDRAAYAATLRDKLETNNSHLDTGFVGTPYLCRMLSHNGANDMAYTLLFNDDFPSWLYEVDMGATTIWERWNSVLPNGYMSDTGMNSLNHYAYGSIVEWMYRNMCGINPCEDAPGFRKLVLEPRPDRRLSHAKASYRTPFGMCESGWAYEGDTLRYTFTIPFDVEAEVHLGNGTVTVNGKAQSADCFHLTAGTYEFVL